MDMDNRQKTLTFEAAMERLEGIVKQLEQGSSPLEESLTLFEEGTALMNQCAAVLENAELRVSQLRPGENGQVIVSPMEEMNP